MKQIRFIASDDKAIFCKMQHGGRMTEQIDEPEDELEALARERAERTPVRSAGAPAPRVAVPVKLPGWTRFATPLLAVIIVLLVAIGGWALGAVIYMHSVDPIAPEDIGYPLLRWSDDVGTSGGYSPESRIMPLAMLGAFPLAILLLLILIYLRKRRSVIAASTVPPASSDAPAPLPPAA
jgi:hypothetical protein